MYQTYLTATQPARERFGYFQALVDRVFCPMHVQPGSGAPQSFKGSIEVTQLGLAQLARVSTSPCLVKRRAQDIHRITNPPYLVKFQTRGESWWKQREREVHLRPGDFVLCSTAEPYSLEFLDTYEMPVLALTAETMRQLTPEPEQFLGVRFDGKDADCGLLSSFVSQVATRMGALSEPMIGRVEANIINLLGAVFSARIRPSAVSAAQQLAQITAFIGAHLKDRRLSPSLIAAAFGVSTRYVHALFEDAPVTVGRYIRSQRVTACRQTLESGSHACQSLTEVALAWGFYDLSHMSRSFREELGMTPSEIRQRAAHCGENADRDSARGARRTRVPRYA